MKLGTLSATSTAPIQCNWLQQQLYNPGGMLNWLASANAPSCSSVLESNTNAVPTLPNGGAPTTQFGASSTPPNGYNAVYYGPDSNGNPVYMYTPTAQTLQQQNVASITSQAGLTTLPSDLVGGNSDLYAGSQLNAAAALAPDCTTSFNTLFNSDCGTPWGLYGAVALGGLFLLNVLLNRAESGRR